MKRPNKERLLSAEAAEGRTSPKGNGGETAAVRTAPGYRVERACRRAPRGARSNSPPYRDHRPAVDS